MKFAQVLAASVVAATATAVPAVAQVYPNQPKPGAARPFTIARPTVSSLPNGLQVIVVERHALPLVSAVLLVRSGSELDPPDRAGLAVMTAGLLTEGVRGGDGRRAMPAPEIAATAEALGGSIGSSASFHGSSAAITVTAPKIGAALELLQAVVRRPAFDPEELDRARDQTLDGLRVSLGQPGTIAGRVLIKEVFGTSAYGHSAAGTPASTTRITREDVVAFHARAYRPDNATLILAGDITPAEAQKLAVQWFGGWRRPAGGPPPVPAAIPASAAVTPPVPVIVDLPGAGQAAGVIAVPSIARSAPDYFAGMVANTVLGGGYSSRLGTEVRIKRGLSYGAGSSLDARQLGGVLSLSAQTKNESAYELVNVMQTELGRMSTDPTPAEELDARKAMLVGENGRSLQTVSGLASRVAGLIIGGVPLDELGTWSQKVQAVTPADVQAFAKQHWNPASAQVVIVGDTGKFGTDGAPASAIRLGVDKLDLDGPGLER